MNKIKKDDKKKLNLMMIYAIMLKHHMMVN
jgi:hypothetical protein